MISDAAALVLFAIRSSIKLGQQMRQAYVDSTKRRDLVLPLPNFFSTPDLISAVNYFDGPGKVHLAQSPRLGELLQKSKTSGKELEGEDLAEVLTCFKEFFNLDLAAKVTERAPLASVSAADQVADLVAYSLRDEYSALRARLGVAVTALGTPEPPQARN